MSLQRKREIVDKCIKCFYLNDILNLYFSSEQKYQTPDYQTKFDISIHFV